MSTEHTPRMLTQADLEVMTPERALELGKQTMASMTQQLGVESDEELCVIQWGKQAFREEEPAVVTGKYMHTNPHAKGTKGFYAVVQYADGCICYVDMNLPQYPRGKKPPWFFDRKVMQEQRDEAGTVTKVHTRTERPADSEHWLEFIPRKDCRKSLKVKA